MTAAHTPLLRPNLVAFAMSHHCWMRSSVHHWRCKIEHRPQTVEGSGVLARTIFCRPMDMSFQGAYHTPGPCHSLKVILCTALCRLMRRASQATCIRCRSSLQGWHDSDHLYRGLQADERGLSGNMHPAQRQLYKDGMSRSSPGITSTAPASANHHKPVSLPPSTCVHPVACVYMTYRVHEAGACAERSSD